MRLDARELGAVLAGLSLLDAMSLGKMHKAGIPCDQAIEIVSTMTGDKSFDPLNTKEIDALCERLNTDQPPDLEHAYQAGYLDGIKRAIDQIENHRNDILAKSTKKEKP